MWFKKKKSCNKEFYLIWFHTGDGLWHLAEAMLIFFLEKPTFIAGLKKVVHMEL